QAALAGPRGVPSARHAGPTCTCLAAIRCANSRFQPFTGGQATPHPARVARVTPPAGVRCESITSSASRNVMAPSSPDRRRHTTARHKPVGEDRHRPGLCRKERRVLVLIIAAVAIGLIAAAGVAVAAIVGSRWLLPAFLVTESVAVTAGLV